MLYKLSLALMTSSEENRIQEGEPFIADAERRTYSEREDKSPMQEVCESKVTQVKRQIVLVFQLFFSGV